MGLTNYTLKGNDPPENNPPETPSSEDGGSPQSSTTLDRIVSAIYNSVVYAQRKVETEHLNRLMSTYFDKDGNALSFKINLPSNEGDIKEFDVPLLTLANHSHLAIKEIEMDLSVDLGHLGDSEEDKTICANLKGQRDENKRSKIKIVMQGQDTPEGIAKINDQLVKLLPN